MPFIEWEAIPRNCLGRLLYCWGVPEADTQALYHFIANAEWDVARFRQRWLQLTYEALRGHSFVLGTNETGDQLYDLTSDPKELPVAITRFVMTIPPGDLQHELGNLYELRP